ncbi:MAG: response regulator [Rubrivivax sp.]|nr:response regulator [Rubrivivax sp.]
MLLEQAWREHSRDPQQLVPLGLAAVEAAGEGTEGAALGWLHVAWGRRYRGELEAAQHALTHAQRLAERLGSVTAAANARDLQAMVWSGQRRWAEALQLLDANLAVDRALRSAHERSSTHLRRAGLFDQLGRRDDALAERYAYAACARESGDDALVAHALGLLGGQHADLYNLEEAERLCAEGALLAERAGAFHAWVIASLNRLNAHVGLARWADALPVVRALQQAEPRMNRRAREQRLIVYADVLAGADPAHLCGEAMALLDESRALRHLGSESLLSWTTARVCVLLAQGRAAEAAEVGEAWLADPVAGTDPAQVPSEQLRLLRALGRAHQQCGRLEHALQRERDAFDVHETLVGRSARARRLALEIAHQLERERWQREQAEQRGRSAEAARARLDELNRALAEASAAKTRFLAAASHDLRQPVQALALYLASLQREALAEPAADLVAHMGQSLQALVAMFEVLLDISRLDAGVVQSHPQPVALPLLLQRLVDEHRAAADAAGLRLWLRLPPGASAATTRSDPVLLERCLRNLLDNALKYTRRGGVLLGLRPVADGWRIDVTDTGIGMSPDESARAFEEFYQAQNSERDRSKGLGLGLAIVQRLAQLLGHRVSLRSRRGRGTRVSVLLPRSLPAAAPVESAADADRPGAAGGRRLIAVVDDDAAVRDSLAGLLQRWGHRVLAAAGAQELLQAWRDAGQPPLDGVLADLRLRDGGDGIAVIAAMRAACGAALPALVITGDIEPSRLQRLQATGLPWLPKPVMPMRLRSWLAGLRPGGGPHPADDP